MHGRLPTAGTAAGCQTQMQGLGEVSWRCAMKASESQNTEPNKKRICRLPMMLPHRENDIENLILLLYRNYLPILSSIELYN